MGAFVVIVNRVDEDGETVEDRMLVERDTRAEAEAVGLAAFRESGDDWTLVRAAEADAGEAGEVV